jgi:hypothetical protein
VNIGFLRLCVSGSAFSRTMKDQTAREQFLHLAASGDAAKLGTDLLAAAREHSAMAAQWQVNRSVRELTSGPVNAHVASENLANVLAASELVTRGDVGENLTNGAFRARAAQLQADPSFQRLARRYSEDPAFRRRLNRSLTESRDKSATLQEVYEQASAQERLRRPEQPERVPERVPEQPQPAAAPV